MCPCSRGRPFFPDPVRRLVNHADYHYTYARLRYPSPNWKYANYPFYTPGGNDRRWNGSGEAEEDGLQWVGGMMYVDVIRSRLPPNTHRHSIVTQLLSPHDNSPTQQYASFSWADLWTIAPWLEDRITKRIDGPGLGI